LTRIDAPRVIAAAERLLAASDDWAARARLTGLDGLSAARQLDYDRSFGAAGRSKD
jgi:hypothetical protein